MTRFETQVVPLTMGGTPTERGRTDGRLRWVGLAAQYQVGSNEAIESPYEAVRFEFKQR